MFRPSFLTPYEVEVSPLAIPVVLVGMAATAYLARGGNLRFGIADEDGSIPLHKDFRAMTVLGGIGANLLPVAGRILVPIVGDIPILGSLVSAVAFGMPDAVVDHLNLLAFAAGGSLFVTEAIAAQETGEFFTLSLPEPPAWLLPSGDAPETPVDAGGVHVPAGVLNAVVEVVDFDPAVAAME